MMGEFEEGEACHYKIEDNNVDVDPDIALSYIDEKIQDVLGHFQKDFEGGVSAENLGAKFGGYGSFLPMYQRSPPILSQPKTPQKLHSMTRSPNHHAVEGAIQTSEVPSNRLPTTKVGPPFCSAQTQQNLSVSSGGTPSRAEKCLSSLQVAETLKKKVYPDHNRNLKVRLKVGSKNAVMKNAEIYSGLGLDDSSGSSPEDSPRESGGKLFHSQESPGESPASILRIMTSFPHPGGILLSPLQDSMLCLVKKENLPRNSTIVPSCVVNQEHPGRPMDESATARVNCKLKKEKKTKLGTNGDKSIELKHEHGTDSENDMTSVRKREVDSEAKDLASSITPPPRVDVGVNGTKGIHSALRKSGAERLKVRLFSSDLAREDSLESISAQECGRSEKQHVKSSSFEKMSEGRVSKSIDDVSVGMKKFSRDKTGIKHANFDSGLTLSKHKEDINSGGVNPSEETFPPRATPSGPGKVKKPLNSAKRLSEGKKKSERTESAHEPVVEVAKETLRDGSCTVPTDEKTLINGIHTSEGKLKSNKEIGMVKQKKTNVFGEAKVGQGDRETYHLNRSSFDGPKGIKIVNPEKRFSSGDNIKERPSCKENGYKTASETLLKENQNGASHNNQNELTSGRALAAANHVIIEEDWVCCDRCQKWRLLPYGTKPEQLPEKWLCSMLNWLPGMNRCDISEEETTRALHALYLLPVPDSQTHLHDNGNKTETGVGTADGQHLDQNHYGKKKDKSKDLHNISGNGSIHIADSQKYHLQDSLKWRKMNGMNQPSDSNLMNEPSFQNPISSRCLITEKNTKKMKNIPTKEGVYLKIDHSFCLLHSLFAYGVYCSNVTSTGDAGKTKNKRVGDHCGDGPSKKIKTDGMHNSYICGDVDQAGGIGRVGLSTKMQRNDEHGYTKDGEFNAKKGLVISVRKPRDQAQILNGEGSLAPKECHKRGIIMKKRKLKGGQVDEDNLEAIRTSSCNLSDSKVHVKEENNEEFKEDKRPLVYKFDVRESNRSKEDDGSMRKDKVPRIRLSGFRGKRNDGMEGLRSTDEDQKPTVHREHLFTQQSLNAADITKRDSGNSHFSTAATSSSSKVSGSCKTRSNFQDLRGSPVESVSSSPLRASYPDGLTSLGRRIASKDHSPRRSLGGKCNMNCQSGTPRKGKDHSVHSIDSGSSHLGHDQHILIPVDQNYEEDILNKDHNIHGRMSPQRHGNGSSLHSRSKDRSSVKISDKDTTKYFNLSSEQEPHPLKNLRHEPEIDPHHLASTNDDVSNVKHQFPDGGNKHNKDDKYLVSKTDSRRKCSGDSKKNNVLDFEEHNNQDVKWGTPYATNGKATLLQNLVQEIKCEKSSNSFSAEKDLIQKDGKERKSEIDQGHGGTSKMLTENLQSYSKTQRDLCSFLPDDASGKDGRLLEQHGTAVNENGSRYASRNVLLSQDAVVETNNPSITKESSSQTATAVLNQAKNLRDYADRLKNSGFSFESNEVYFQAALEFLYGTSLLEASGNEIARHGEMNHMQTYSSTAKLCESCAHEYDQRKEMASATLAYKCMEVAYMRVVYYKCSSSSRDWQELQSLLQKIPPGESPSSSISDVDNPNNQGMVDKAAFSKGIGGNNLLVAKKSPSFLRLLDFTQDIISAMEAASKSQNAFAAATVGLEEAHNTEGFISLKRVVDFSFQDVEGLVCLVRLAKEAIGRSVQRQQVLINAGRGGELHKQLRISFTNQPDCSVFAE
ncbi:Zinc finger, CW-type [Dillenia turbinata]|uniref:Zinc finger, CW-type n=1 Tax=Dillenia turbinata TaxID=194707 RepID=A0AAN8VB27_9MAGN